VSIRYRIDEDLGVTFVRWDGIVTANEFLAHVRRLTTDPAWPPHRLMQLTDLRALADHSSIDDATLAEAASLFGAHPRIQNLKAAIVAGDTLVKANLFERLVARFASVITFNSLNRACKVTRARGATARTRPRSSSMTPPAARATSWPVSIPTNSLRSSSATTRS
jgi:hypothetical protein